MIGQTYSCSLHGFVNFVLTFVLYSHVKISSQTKHVPVQGVSAKFSIKPELTTVAFQLSVCSENFELRLRRERSHKFSVKNQQIGSRVCEVGPTGRNHQCCFFQFYQLAPLDSVRKDLLFEKKFLLSSRTPHAFTISYDFTILLVRRIFVFVQRPAYKVFQVIKLRFDQQNCFLSQHHVAPDRVRHRTEFLVTPRHRHRVFFFLHFRSFHVPHVLGVAQVDPVEAF